MDTLPRREISRRAVRPVRRHGFDVACLEQRSLLSTLYAVGSGVGAGTSSLYKIAEYSTTPTAVEIGNTGVLLTDLAIDPRNDAAYAISFRNLYAINLTTGKATEIGPLGFPGMNALTFSPTGTLYAMSTYSPELYTVNLTTGAATIAFDTGYVPQGALGFDKSGVLYLTAEGNHLVQINVRAQTAKDVGRTGVPRLFGLTIDSDGTIYSGQGSNEGPTAVIYRLSPTTGHATRIGTIANASKLGLDGLSFAAPAPSLSIGNLTIQARLGSTVDAVFTVSLSRASIKKVTVDYATADGTATAPSDYLATSGVLTFAPGQTSEQVKVVVKDDPTAPANSTKTFGLELSAAAGAPIAKGVGMGTIVEEPAQTLYAVGSAADAKSSSLYDIDGYYAAPKAERIGQTGALLTALAINPQNGAAYAISTANLYSINLQTGNATEIGSLGVSGMIALAFSPAGTLYAMASNSEDLYTINSKTGHATMDFATGYTPTGGITFGTSGALYLTTATDLVRVKLANKKATIVGSTGVSDLAGLAFSENGAIYATQTSNGGKYDVVYKINSSTGHATKIRTIDGAPNIDFLGLAF
jgi:sugar lactone lactonase YvrE